MVRKRKRSKVRRRGLCTRDYWGSRRRDSYGRFASPRKYPCVKTKRRKGRRKRR